MVTDHGYPSGKIWGDYLRAVIGLSLCLSPYLLGTEVTSIVLIFLCGALLFFLYGLKTISRHLLGVKLNDNELTIKVINKNTFMWDRLTDLSLSYFSTRPNVGDGWMQLRLRLGKKTLRIESSVTGFDIIVRRAIAAASSNRIKLSDTTIQNIEALAIEIDGIGRLK